VFYVDRDSLGGTCSDDGPGTSPISPWCSIGEANRRLTPGDTVEIRAGVYAESVAPLKSGTESNPIIYSSFRDDVVTLAGVETAVKLVDRQHITIDGIDCQAVDRYVTLDNSHHILIENGRFTGHNSRGGWPTGIIFKNNSHHNRLRHCVVGAVGYSTADDDKGCVMNLGVWENAEDHSDHNLLEDNVFFHGGHHVLAISSNYNVIRNNYFHNENWMDCERVETGRKCGNRSIIFEYDPSNVTWNVVEGNRFAFSGVPPDQNTSSGLSLRTPHNIVRRNVFYYNDGPGMGISTLTGLWDASDNHVYHNVYFHNGYTALSGVEEWKQAGLLVAHHGAGAQIKDLGIKNNIFHENKTHGVKFYYVDSSDQAMAGNWEESGPPGFVDVESAPDPLDPAVPDFHLVPDSPCVDGGDYLTRTSGRGSGTTIAVDDAGYFSDGRGVVAPDRIQLEGDSVPALVVSIDYVRNTLTVDRQLTWYAGQGVSQPYEGHAPDIGAFEHAPGAEPTATSTVAPTRRTATPTLEPTEPTATPEVVRTPTDGPGPIQGALYLPLAHG
jgi:hypothetical protein